MISVRLPDGSVKEYADDSTSLDVANSIGSRLAQAVLAAKTNGTVVDSAGRSRKWPTSRSPSI